MAKTSRRPALIDRIQLWFSSSRRIDGLWVGTLEGDDKAETIFRRVDEALRLIKAHDPLRYKRLHRDLERVWVLVLPGVLGSYNEGLRACQLDSRHVLAEETSSEMIAATIVHEATHARLFRCGVGYGEALRARVEAVCLRRERAFAAKLPNGRHVRESLEPMLDAYASPGLWTDAAMSDRHAEGSAEALRHLGTPAWLVKLIMAAHRRRMRRRKRASGKAQP